MAKLFFFPLLLFIFGCGSNGDEVKGDVLARVGSEYLYKDEVGGLVPAGASKEDSIAIIKNFIDRWASQKLLISAAEINLNESTKAGFDDLVSQYKSDLYTGAYIEAIVKTSVDTVVSEEEFKAFYKLNKENFRTNSTLVRLRYVHLQKDNPKYETIRSRFFDYRKSDSKFWETYALQFKDFALNDTVWVEMSQVYSRLPFITPDNSDKFIVPGKAIQQADSANVYLVKITNVLDKNQIGPFDYLKPTLREVILNKRKLELIRKFEKDITDDAIKDKKYEIYK